MSKTECHQFEQINKVSFVRFVLVGASATFLHYLLMGCLIYFLGVLPIISSAIGYVSSTLYNYWANSQFSFGNGRKHRRSLPRFLMIALIGLGINHALLSIGIYLKLQISISQLFATAVVLIWNYSANAIWTFNKKGEL